MQCDSDKKIPTLSFSQTIAKHEESKTDIIINLSKSGTDIINLEKSGTEGDENIGTKDEEKKEKLIDNEKEWVIIDEAELERIERYNRVKLRIFAII